jgi:hypothetical protein
MDNSKLLSHEGYVQPEYRIFGRSPVRVRPPRQSLHKRRTLYLFDFECLGNQGTVEGLALRFQAASRTTFCPLLLTTPLGRRYLVWVELRTVRLAVVFHTGLSVRTCCTKNEHWKRGNIQLLVEYYEGMWDVVTVTLQDTDHTLSMMRKPSVVELILEPLLALYLTGDLVELQNNNA